MRIFVLQELLQIRPSRTQEEGVPRMFQQGIEARREGNRCQSTRLNRTAQVSHSDEMKFPTLIPSLSFQSGGTTSGTGH